MRELLVLKCEHEIEPTEGTKKAMAEIEQFFLDEQKPQVFDPYEKNNVLMESERQFEELANTMEDNGSFNPKQLTEYEWYGKVVYYEKKFKAMTGKT